jgi:hypothetical protein
MTDEQINQRIAEACGWKGNLIDRDMQGNLWPSEPPNYCADLNAMHEAEKVLTGLTRHAYCDALLDTVPDSPDHLWEVLTATARQRAEAFLRTLGKWPATDKESLTVEATTEQSSAVHIGDTTEMVKEVQK